MGPHHQTAISESGKFVIISELKCLVPTTTGSLRRRYDLGKLAFDFTVASASALSVNCDGVLFGGSQEDITKGRQVSSSAAVEGALAEDGAVVPPVIASDLLLYPYQLYKLRLAGTDAVNLLVGALVDKDLLYISKIAASLQIQTLATCTSEVQLQAVGCDQPPGRQRAGDHRVEQRIGRLLIRHEWTASIELAQE